MNLTELLPLVYHKLPYLIAGLFGVGAVITVHEFGHFIFGKLFNVHIPEFSIGVGPKLFSKKIGETTFCLSAIPVGAYVAADQDPVTAGGYERTIQAKKYWQKLIIVSGGVLFNLIFAYLLLVGLSMTGIPASPLLSGDHLVEQVMPNTAADRAGLLPQDHIIKMDDTVVKGTIEKLLTTIQNNPGKTVMLEVVRAGSTLTLPCTLDVKMDTPNEPKGSLGIQFAFTGVAPVSFASAVPQAAHLLKTLVIRNAQQMGHIFQKRSAKNLSGPLGMIYMAIDSASKGFLLLLLLMVIINVALAVLNIIPLPILDGWHVVTYTIEAVRGKPLNETVQNYISYAALGLFASLFIYLTFQDTIRIFFS